MQNRWLLSNSAFSTVPCTSMKAAKCWKWRRIRICLNLSDRLPPKLTKLGMICCVVSILEVICNYVAANKIPGRIFTITEQDALAFPGLTTLPNTGKYYMECARAFSLGDRIMLRNFTGSTCFTPCTASIFFAVNWIANTILSTAVSIGGTFRRNGIGSIWVRATAVRTEICFFDAVETDDPIRSLHRPASAKHSMCWRSDSSRHV